jgi:hypothetical protein
MKSGIRFTKIWADEDMLELRVEVCDGRSLFMNQIYVGHQLLADTVSGLHRFKGQIYGGLFNLRFGEFGPEHASGALDVRLHFRKHGKLLIRVLAQSQFRCFEDRELSSDATLHLVSEPALLDNFVVGLRALRPRRITRFWTSAVNLKHDLACLGAMTTRFLIATRT